MNVLFWMPRAGVIPGGHSTQHRQTARHLQQLGINVQVSHADEPDFEKYDLVHGFELRPCDMQMCRRRGLPVALSPIYWNHPYVTQHKSAHRLLDTWQGRARAGIVLLNSALRGQHLQKCEAYLHHSNRMRVTFAMADILMPNSEMEAQAIRADLAVITAYQVVPNAVDPATFNCHVNPETDAEQQDSRDYVLYVGRFEPHKNQLGLMEAMRHSNIPLVLAGPPHPHHPSYYQQCLRRAGRNISIVPAVAHEELPSLYRAAKAHVLPSWSETTGLVSLEAALCGCNIVTTERGYTREYFQDLAWYCDPAAPRSIRRAVEAAFHAPPRPELRQRILDNYTWEHTAQATLAAYEQVLRVRRRGATVMT